MVPIDSTTVPFFVVWHSRREWHPSRAQNMSTVPSNSSRHTVHKWARASVCRPHLLVGSLGDLTQCTLHGSSAELFEADADGECQQRHACRLNAPDYISCAVCAYTHLIVQSIDEVILDVGYVRVEDLGACECRKQVSHAMCVGSIRANTFVSLC